MKEDKAVDLKILLPHEEIQVGGETLVLAPFAFGKITKVLKHATTIITMISSLPENAFDAEGKLNLEDPSVTVILMIQMAEGGDVLLDLMSLATDKPRAWIEALNPEEGIRLLMKIWEVNHDFFTQRLAPLMQEYQMLKVGPSKPSVGAQ